MNSAARQVGAGEVIASLADAWKLYGSFAALKGVNVALRRGEIHMLMGENGAGKSTLVGLLIGTHRPDQGTVQIFGRTVEQLTPLQARAEGINAVLQDFSLAPALTVAENYFLGREVTKGGLLSRASMRAETRKAVARLGVTLDVDRNVSTLTRAEQQVLEIVRAIGGNPGALILDEPTAALSHQESEQLFTILGQLRSEGWAILYITHRMEEVRRLGDWVTVLRDGQCTGSYPLSQASNERIVQDMVGRPLTTLYPDIPHRPGSEALTLDGLTSLDSKLKGVLMTVRAGEIVGLGGLVGCGKAEVARAVFGLAPIASGSIRRDGQAVQQVTPKAMLDGGLVYLPQDRRGEALSLNRSIADNMTAESWSLPGFSTLGFLRWPALKRLVVDLMERLDVRPREASKPVQELSGGNQQKVVLGRALSRDRRVYIFDEPTAGVDVGARLDFYTQLRRLCAEGAAILLITSDLQELIHLSHRVYVMHDGSIVAELTGADIREDRVVACSFGETSEAQRSLAS